MPAYINILIHGLAVCFREEDYWKVMFLCDDQHRLKFTHRKNAAPASQVKELRKNNREIFFEVTNPKSPTKDTGDYFEKIFNMSGLYAHRDGVKLKTPTTKDVVTMTIPYAELYMESPKPPQFPSEEEYHIKIKGRDETETRIGFVARTIGARIILNPGGNLIVRGRDTDFPANLPHSPHDDGTTYVLNFDNNCLTNECQSDNDFEMYYELLSDKVNPDLRFIAGRPPLHPVLRSTPDGNCDPVKIVPPPDPLGGP